MNEFTKNLQVFMETILATSNAQYKDKFYVTDRK